MSEPFDPAALDEDAFLVGPDRYADWDGMSELMDVDPVFGKAFSAIWAEIAETEPDALRRDDSAAETAAVAAPGYRFASVGAGVLLISPEDRPVGGYLGCDLAIDPGHQGRGLGAELVLEYAMRHHRIPVWDHGTAGFSPAGEQAHRRAHRLAQDRVLFARKSGALAAAETSLCKTQTDVVAPH